MTQPRGANRKQGAHNRETVERGAGRSHDPLKRRKQRSRVELKPFAQRVTGTGYDAAESVRWPLQLSEDMTAAALWKCVIAMAYFVPAAMTGQLVARDGPPAAMSESSGWRRITKAKSETDCDSQHDSSDECAGVDADALTSGVSERNDSGWPKTQA